MVVGYLLNRPSGPQGEPGPAYNYLLCGNGLFVRAEGPHLKATVPVALCQVRGLAPQSPCVELVHGRVPRRLWDLALSLLLIDPRRELYVAVVWDGLGYSLRVPDQAVGGAAVRYETVKDTVVELHSHGPMRAFFSGIDDEDERGFKVYGVVGRLPETPEVNLRVGIYGYFHPLRWEDVFGG